MGVLDAVVNEAGNQLGISNSSASSVLSGLLSFINVEDGGVSGFLDRFRRAGVGNLVTSWLGGETKAASPDAVESAMGRDSVSRIASKAGLSATAAASAIGFMLPRLIQRIAPGGTIPSRLSPDVASYIAGPTAAMASGVRQATYAAETVAKPVDIARYLWPLLGLLALGALLAVWFANRGTTVNTDTFSVEDQVRLATQRATAALDGLRPGFTAQDLVSALNVGVINFPTGSAQIPPDSYDFLNSAAAALKKAPSGAQIDVGGHTDNTGNAGANLQLSQQRATAVRDYLIQQGVSSTMLSATGYGQTRPIGSNDTEEGRFRNRRIEFAVK